MVEGNVVLMKDGALVERWTFFDVYEDFSEVEIAGIY